MKHVIVILDGASGEPVPGLGGLTTLEAAFTPHLDALAQEGRVGLAFHVPPGMEPSSNVACTSIVGFDPSDYPIGRGALELSALGVELADDEVALRANLCHVSPEGIMVSYSCDNISNSDGHALAEELKAALDDDQCTLYKGTGFRQYLVVKGHPGLMGTEMAAAHNITDLNIADFPPTGPEAEFISDYMRRANKALAESATNATRIAEGKMPATNLMCFWPGQRPSGMPAFADVYKVQAALNSGVDLLAGIAALTGIHRYDIPGVTDGPDNDYAAQGEGALSMLADYDVVFVHVESPDAEGHDGNIEGKKSAIEAIDREIISRIRAYAKSNPLRILALPDHPTPVIGKRHTADPVPFVMAGPGIEANPGSRLTEAEGAASGLRIDPGFELLGYFLDSKG
ncbi:MAG: 2,3-bisphosphoglycerate-independent phosphoglycerate mutase [Coriobacteriia bacterium]|nr:2,3-bisphosphoglycerate-independent phosphoglycerate mutase [Coriobacteriia bacterium]